MAAVYQGHGVCRDDYPAADFGRWSLTAEILKKQFTKYFYGHHALGILDKVSDDTPFSPQNLCQCRSGNIAAVPGALVM